MNDSPMYVVIKIPGWRNFDFGEARYYGWRWAICLGPRMIFFWPYQETPPHGLTTPERAEHLGATETPKNVTRIRRKE